MQTLGFVLKQNLHLTNIQQTKEIVLIKRSKKRSFLYHDAILEMIQRHAKVFNMIVSVFGDDPVPSLKETIRMFSQAAIVVAPHGAGESNLIFSKPGTVLIEGLCWDRTRYNFCYRNFAQSIGLIYHGLIFSKGCLEITAEDVERAIVHYLLLVQQRI